MHWYREAIIFLLLLATGNLVMQSSNGAVILSHEKREIESTKKQHSQLLDEFFASVEKRSIIPTDQATEEEDIKASNEVDHSYEDLMDKYVEDDSRGSADGSSGSGNEETYLVPRLEIKRETDNEDMTIKTLAEKLATFDEEDVVRRKRELGELGDETKGKETTEPKKNTLHGKDLTDDVDSKEIFRRSDNGEMMDSLISKNRIFYDRKSKQIIIKKRAVHDAKNIQKRNYIPDSDPNADWIMAHQKSESDDDKKPRVFARSVIDSVDDETPENSLFRKAKNDDGEDERIVPVTGVWSGLGSRPVFVHEKTKRDQLGSDTTVMGNTANEKLNSAKSDTPYSYENQHGKTIVAYDDIHEVIRTKTKASDENQPEIKAKASSAGNNNSSESIESSSGSGESSTRPERDIAEMALEKKGSVKLKTLSVLYRTNDEEDEGRIDDITKRDFIHVKRSLGDDGYVGCYADYLHPQRDLPVRAGIPFVTPNNCRSACLRTGYYYAGLQYGYLCFCGNTYGRYDAVPDSECSNSCSGNASVSCGGYWRNAVYATAGAAVDSHEGPIPFYLPPKTQEELEEESNSSQTGNSKSSVEKPSEGLANATVNYAYPPINGTVINPFLRAPPTPKVNLAQTTRSVVMETTHRQIIAPNSTEDTTTTATTTAKQTTASAESVSMAQAVNQVLVKPQGQDALGSVGDEVVTDATTQTTTPSAITAPPNGTDSNGKRLVLMHWAYLHPQHPAEIVPTSMPPPTPPLRIEPGTRVFKGEVKMKQNWYDDLLETQSSKYQILAGNIEQGLRNIYANDSSFLKAEVLAFREGLVNHNPNTVHKVIAEFALTFNQFAHSPDAKLLDYAEQKKTIDEMPVFTKSIKLQEYNFDPSNPVHSFSTRQKYSPVAQITKATGLASDWTQDSNIPNPLNSPIQSVLQNTGIPVSAGPQPQYMYKVQGKDDPLNQHVEQIKSRQQQQQQQQQREEQRSQSATQTQPQPQNEGQQATRSLTPHSPLQAFQAEGNLEPITKTDATSKQKRAQPVRRTKVPYILRLFFWKDMVARKKRALKDAQLAKVLKTRRRRHTKRSLPEAELVEENFRSRPKQKRKKVKRATKEPSDEKELHRSKRS